jgi:hypothetical protein
MLGRKPSLLAGFDALLDSALWTDIVHGVNSYLASQVSTGIFSNHGRNNPTTATELRRILFARLHMIGHGAMTIESAFKVRYAWICWSVFHWSFCSTTRPSGIPHVRDSMYSTAISVSIYASSLIDWATKLLHWSTLERSWLWTRVSMSTMGTVL